jgi:hypothetical protein
VHESLVCRTGTCAAKSPLIPKPTEARAIVLTITRFIMELFVEVPRRNEFAWNALSLRLDPCMAQLPFFTEAFIPFGQLRQLCIRKFLDIDHLVVRTVY